MLTQPIARRPARLWPALIAFALAAWVSWVLPAAAGEPSKPVPDPAQAIKVKAGEEVTVTFPVMKRVAVKDPDIADISVEGGTHLHIKGQSKGKTSVVVWTGSSEHRLEYTVEVE